MKLQIKQISLLALATLVLAACSNDGDSLPENPLPADRLIRVIAAVNSPATRAGATTDNLHSFGLFIVNDKDSAYSYQNVYMNKEDDGTWKGYKNADKESLDTPMMWESAERHVWITAYAPYVESANSVEYTFRDSVRTAQDVPQNVIASDRLCSFSFIFLSIEENYNDIWYSLSEKALMVAMKHSLSKLRVNIRYAAGIAPGSSVEAVILQNTNVSYDYYIKIGRVLSPSNIANITLAKDELSTSGYNASYEAIVVPQDAQFDLRLKIGGQAYAYFHPSKFTFEQNKLYTLNLTVGEAAVRNGAVSSQEWPQGTDGNLQTD